MDFCDWKEEKSCFLLAGIAVTENGIAFSPVLDLRIYEALFPKNRIGNVVLLLQKLQDRST
mgnify:CR=1 FL=1